MMPKDIPLPFGKGNQERSVTLDIERKLQGGILNLHSSGSPEIVLAMIADHILTECPYHNYTKITVIIE